MKRNEAILKSIRCALNFQCNDDKVLEDDPKKVMAMNNESYGSECSSSEHSSSSCSSDNY